jgi:hypothetical protein
MVGCISDGHLNCLIVIQVKENVLFVTDRFHATKIVAEARH